MLSLTRKWATGVRVGGGFRISVSVRLKPENLSKRLAADAQARKELEELRRKKAKQAAKEKAEAKRKASRPSCPWDRGAPRFSTTERELRRKRLEQEEVQL